MSKSNIKKQRSSVYEKKTTILKKKNAPGNKKLLPKQYDFKVVALIGFLLSLLVLVFCYQFFGSYFEMNDDPRYVMAMKGFASPLPYDNFVSVYKFTISLYIFLYKYLPNIGWYGFSMFLLLLGSLFNIFITLYLAAKNRIAFPLIILIFIAFCFGIYFQNIYWINFTRPSILVTSSFIILLGVLYVNSEILKSNKWILIFPVLTYVIGHCTRLDAGYLGFAFGFVFAVLFVVFQKNIFPFLLKFMLPVLMFILAITTIDVISKRNNQRNNEFLEKTEIIRQLIDYRNAAAYVPQNINDTIAYNAMVNARYCSDNNVISVPFLKKLTQQSPLIPSGNELKFKDEFGVFLDSLNAENKVAANLNYAFLFIVFIWFVTSVKHNYIGFLKYLLFQVFFIVVIAAMSYFMKLPARIFNPLLVVLTFSNLIYLFSMFHFEKKLWYLLITFPIAVSLAAIPKYSSANKEAISRYDAFGKINHMMFDDMNSNFSNTIFIPTTLRSWEMHNATDPIKEINFKNKNCYVYLTIELSLAPETQDQLLAKFGTYDHAELFKKISAMNNVIFISEDNFNNFLRAYYHYLYKQDYYFEKVTNILPSFYQYTGLSYYRLRK